MSVATPSTSAHSCSLDASAHAKGSTYPVSTPTPAQPTTRVNSSGHTLTTPAPSHPAPQSQPMQATPRQPPLPASAFFAPMNTPFPANPVSTQRTQTPSPSPFPHNLGHAAPNTPVTPATSIHPASATQAAALGTSTAQDKSLQAADESNSHEAAVPSRLVNRAAVAKVRRVPGSFTPAPPSRLPTLQELRAAAAAGTGGRGGGSGGGGGSAPHCRSPQPPGAFVPPPSLLPMLAYQGGVR